LRVAHSFIVRRCLEPNRGLNLIKNRLIFSSVIIFTCLLLQSPIMVLAVQNVQQATCPTYTTNLAVDWVDSVPHSATVGDTVVTTFHVIYPDGTPVTLSPETASFTWIGPSRQMQFAQVAVTYNGTPGFYTYAQVFSQSLIQATGSGTITIYVNNCSCSDAQSNHGPTGNISSIETSDSSPIEASVHDNSQMNGNTPPTQIVARYAVPIVIILLLFLALLLLIRRRRRKS
jgi:hypothetical protein